MLINSGSSAINLIKSPNCPNMVCVMFIQVKVLIPVIETLTPCLVLIGLTLSSNTR